MSDKLLLLKINLVFEKVSLLDEKVNALSNQQNSISINDLNLSETTKSLFKSHNIHYLHQLKEMDVVHFLKKYSKTISPSILLKEISIYLNNG